MRRTVAIIGGGPAGAMAAERLAETREGWVAWNVVLFEENLGWEKPCGGGVTPKALRRYPFLQGRAEGKMIPEIEFAGANGARARLHLGEPLAIFSRTDLNTLLLRRAETAGAEIVQDRILSFGRPGPGWELQGRLRSYRADYLVLAAGARSRLRGLLTRNLRAQDFMITFGYYVPGGDDIVRIQFFRDFEGYAWAFPRPGHYSIGICAKVGESSMGGMRKRLHSFMSRFGYPCDSSRIYSHVLPALTPSSWCELRLNGEGWALAGDVGGLVDPVTGEGIYYALRSGELVAESLLEGAPHLYPVRLAEEFGRSLTVGSRLARLFYHADFLKRNLTTRLVELSAASRKFAALTHGLVTGSLSYDQVVSEISRILPFALPEIIGNGLREGLAALRGGLMRRAASIGT